MPGRRLFLTHSAAEDRERPSGQDGQAVHGFAVFYWPGKAWLKIPPGRLGVAELWGGASGFGNNEALISSKRLNQPTVEFYYVPRTATKPKRHASYVAINGAVAEYFTFGFFGKRFS